MAASVKWVLITYLFFGEERFFLSDGMFCRSSKILYGRYFFDPKAVLERKIPNLHMKKFSPLELIYGPIGGQRKSLLFIALSNLHCSTKHIAKMTAAAAVEIFLIRRLFQIALVKISLW